MRMRRGEQIPEKSLSQITWLCGHDLFPSGVCPTRSVSSCSPFCASNNQPGDRASLIAGLVSHHGDAIAQRGIDAEFTPVSCTSTNVVTGAHLSIASQMPSQPDELRHLVPACRELLAVLVALRREHLGDGGGCKEATPLEGAAIQIGLQKVAEFRNRPKQPSIGCAIDEETVKRGVPASCRAKDAPIHQQPSE